MRSEKAIEIFNRIEEDRTIQNFISQGNSRYILFNVNEPSDNFPAFTARIDQRLASIAYTYLSIGCTLAEENDFLKASPAFEKGASILEYIHSPVSNRKEESAFYLLTSALAHYASFQYSKAFIILKSVEYDQPASHLIASFLKKDFRQLQLQVNAVLLSDFYEDTRISQLEDDQEAQYRICTYFIARALASVLEYFFSGNEESLKRANETLQDILEISASEDTPTIWWLLRLLKIIIGGLSTASVWNSILPKLGEINDEILNRYIRGLAFGKPNIVELFTSQILALDKTLSDDGAVVGLPTSSGKTRIAEIAILQELITNEDSIVLYLAPFRSLAFEVEESLSNSFSLLGFEVSHLYGGSQFNKIDRSLIDESRIIVATPEKAKAIIRADKEIAKRIKLVIIDEGHLLGGNKRNIVNELFVEELKVHVSNNGGKLILLSAVLPNTEEISRWITGSNDGVIKSSWRPSSQRLGRMEWTGQNVNIIWESNEEPAPYNYDFIEKIKPPKRRNDFPHTKREAIAATATKLVELGSVLIFVGRANMINGQAQDVKKALIYSGFKELIWDNTEDWETFELACDEAYGQNSKILDFARYGIICHDGGLPADVRSNVEKLMRNGNPRIIISTTTLGQGVNVGVSSVIIANVYIGTTPIKKTEFWNIAGRAGRAFVDSEGKILYAIDLTQAPYMVRYNRNLAKNYFEANKMNSAESGLLLLIKVIFDIAERCDINQETLLELISENDYSKFIDDLTKEDYSSEIENALDWMDDTLLALNVEFESQNLDEVSDWIDDCFRNSLAYIQALSQEEFDEGEVLSFFKARNKGVIKLAGEAHKWNSYVASGIPLRSSLIIEEQLDEILEIVNDYNFSEQSIGDLITFHEKAESITKSFPSDQFGNDYDIEELNNIRSLWLAGESMDKIQSENKNGLKICSSYFAFTLPWGLNAIARKLKDMDYLEEGEVFSDLAVFSELGLPNMHAARIYLAGIRSRVASTELSSRLDFHIETKLREINRFLLDNIEELRLVCTETTVRWLETLSRADNKNRPQEIKLSNFKFESEGINYEEHHFLREFQNRYFFCNADYSTKIELNVHSDELKVIANNLGVHFEFEEYWKMKVRNPHVLVRI